MRITDILTESIASLPFDTNPKIGYWEDKKYVDVYHGTHDQNVPDILKNGINRFDPQTGMISVTLDPYTAHGYAAMSGAGGEAKFRAAQARPVYVPEKDRSVIKIRLPIEWLKSNMDRNFSGNIGTAFKHITSRDEYEKWKKDNRPDYQYYQLSEFRLKKPIAPEFILGVMKKV